MPTPSRAGAKVHLSFCILKQPARLLMLHCASMRHLRYCELLYTNAVDMFMCWLYMFTKHFAAEMHSESR